jgi:hypothetical protein
MFISFDLEAVILNDGIAQYLVARLVNFLAPKSFVGIGKFDFQVFPDMHGADAFVAHLFEGALNRLALRIEHGLFWCNDNLGFHINGALPAAQRDVKAGRRNVKAGLRGAIPNLEAKISPNDNSTERLRFAVKQHYIRRCQ